MTDYAGNKTVVLFIIDTVFPEVTGVTDGNTYGASGVTPVYTGGTAELNGEPYDSGTFINRHGDYTLIVQDKAGNTITVSFVIDRESPMITEKSMTSDNSNHSQIAREGDIVTLSFRTAEAATISNMRAYIEGVTVDAVTLDDAGDKDPLTWRAYFPVDSSTKNGLPVFHFDLTDEVGNHRSYYTNFSSVNSVTVDTKAPEIISSVVQPNNGYIDVTFSEGVFGGTDGKLAIDKSDIKAVTSDGTSDGNPSSVTIDSITKTDGSELTGGESMIRVHVSFTGEVTKGDTLEIMTVNGAIRDQVGNIIADDQTTGEKTLNTTLGYTWDEATNTITLTGLTVEDNTSGDRVQLITARDDLSIYDADFQTRPTNIGGSNSLISISAGLDKAEFWNTGDGLFANAVGSGKIQLELVALGNMISDDTIMKQDNLQLYIQDAEASERKITLSFNIDSTREDTIILN